MINSSVKNHPLILTIFGGTGDLAQNKIFAALYDLKKNNLLPDQYKIVGFSRRPMSDIEYRKFVADSLQKGEDESVQEFLQNIFYAQGDITDVESYDSLKKCLSNLDEDLSMCANKIFYLAVPPKLYKDVFLNLDKAEMVKPCGKDTGKDTDIWTRVLVEKPFGENPEEAMKLDHLLGKLFDEKQIFRIDHYLAKEALQNIITFRFANAIFEPIWNNKMVEKVEINLFETDDVSARGAFYDSVGALRDVGQNHILQMLALVAMDDPHGLSADKIRTSREKALSKVGLYHKDISKSATLAQYRGYQQEPGVSENSQTETYFQLKLEVKNSRWKGVPFYVSSGKALGEKKVEIRISFKEKESCVCPVDGICHYGNTITISVQPEEKITVGFWTKKPGLKFELEEKDLSFNYEDNIVLNDAYEKVLYDCLIGDQALFTSTNEVATQWRLIDKICNSWKKCEIDTYEKGVDPNKLAKIK